MKKEQKLPLPPFDEQSAKQKVRMAENGWNLKNPKNISMAYSHNSKWRNRNIFLNGRDEIIEFLDNKFNKELNYKLCKELWAFTNNKIAVRFAYEWHDKNNQWYRSYGNENWEFDENGLMKIRFASINDLKIDKADRKLLWKEDIRPENYKSLTEMGL